MIPPPLLESVSCKHCVRLGGGLRKEKHPTGDSSAEVDFIFLHIGVYIYIFTYIPCLLANIAINIHDKDYGLRI